MIHNRNKTLLFLTLGCALSVVSYQNCSGSATFTASENLNSLVDDTVPVVPQFATKIAGDAESFPPLKLLFVVDNSGTMEINQINLASAFDQMFAGSNATNLAPFDTTAFVISTSQNSPNKTDAVFAKLPSQTAEAFASMNAADFQSHRGATLSGLIPGDLVGYGLSAATTSDRTVTSFYPAPVSLFRPGIGGSTVVTRYSHKSRGGSVSEFSSDFKERLAVLNPTKSAIDASTKRGVLDDVVDKESGLCAVARVLRNNQGFINAGDLASIIIVSDENDSDPSGRACYDSIIEAKSGVNYIDGRCEMARTSLSYREEIADPSKAKCKVDYQTGFGYQVDYKYPTTNVSYYTKSMKYDQLQTIVSYYTSKQEYNQRRTNVSYYTSKQMYDKLETPVTYYTKSPTYKAPRTNVKYFTEVESCTIRDGAKTNCTYTYPSSNTTLDGAFANNCDAFVAGKLPNGALYSKAGYKPECSAGTPVAKSGTCSASDTSILDCQQNYSNPITIRLAGKLTSTCDAFTAGRLPSGALTSSSTDPGYTPACGNLLVTSDQTGSCSVSDTDKQNCRTVYTAAATPKTVNGVPGSATCNDFAKAKLAASDGAVYGVAGYLPTCAETTPTAASGTCSATDANVTDCRTTYAGPVQLTASGRIASGNCEATFKSKLPSNAVLGDSTRPVACSDGPTLTDKTGTCSTTDTNVANCRNVYAQATSTALDGAFGSDCAAFVSNRLPSGAVYTDAGYTPSCTVGTSKDKNVTGDDTFAKWPSFNAVVNGACSDAIRDSVVSSKGLVVAAGTTATCKVTKLNSTSQTLSDSTKDLSCAVAEWQKVCTDSSGARRSCVPSDIAAGEKYAAATTTKTYEGQLSCDMLCSKTNFCKDKSGTLADNFYECKTTAASNVTKSSFTLEPETKTCGTGETRVVTNGPYKTTETKPAYVASAKSEANSATALADMILERSRELFRDSLPIMSVFVRQTGDTLGTNGSYGTEYNRLADMFGGKKLSVLSSAAQYASALEDLSGKIRERLGQSVSFREVGSHQEIRRVWLKTKNAADYVLVSTNLWSASGGTITVSKDLSFTYGDEFKIEYW